MWAGRHQLPHCHRNSKTFSWKTSPGVADHHCFHRETKLERWHHLQWVDEWNSPRPSRQEALDPGGKSSWEKLQSWMREQEDPIPSRVSPGGTRRDTQHLGTFVGVTSSMARRSANLVCIPGYHLFSAICCQCGWKGVLVLLLWADLWLVYLYASPTLLML